jgi:hypothetical protein
MNLFNQTCKDNVFQQKAITAIISQENREYKSKYRTNDNSTNKKRQSGRRMVSGFKGSRVSELQAIQSCRRSTFNTRIWLIPINLSSKTKTTMLVKNQENLLKLNRGVGYASAPIVLLIFVFVEEEILL